MSASADVNCVQLIAYAIVKSNRMPNACVLIDLGGK